MINCSKWRDDIFISSYVTNPNWHYFWIYFLLLQKNGAVHNLLSCCVQSLSSYFLTILNTVCLALKALHVQEERDRLRLEFNELEERVNPNFLLSVSSFHPWCVVCLIVLESFSQSACTSIPVGPFGTKISPCPNYVCMCVCTRLCTSVCAHVYTRSSRCTPATTPVLCGCVRCRPLQRQHPASLPCRVSCPVPQQQ